jgi:xylulokinase
MLAAIAAGWYPSAEAASAAMAAAPTQVVEPAPMLAPAYRARKEIYRDLYYATRDTHTRLAKLNG